MYLLLVLLDAVWLYATNKPERWRVLMRLRFLTSAVFLLVFMQQSMALDYPERPIRIYVGSGAGGTLDIVMRTLELKAEAVLGQKIILINSPGALGMLAARAAMDAQPDGYTIATITPGALTAMEEQPSPGYSQYRLRFITGLVTFPLLLAVKADSGIRTVKDLIMRKPSFFGVSNTIGELGAKAFLEVGGIQSNPQQVYYRGKEPDMLLSLIRGDIQFVFITAPALRSQLNSGGARAIAVIAEKRSAIYPNVPTLTEALAEAGRPPHKKVREPTLGLAGPHDLPEEIVNRLRTSFRAMLKEPEVKKRLDTLPAESTNWNGWD